MSSVACMIFQVVNSLDQVHKFKSIYHSDYVFDFLAVNEMLSVYSLDLWFPFLIGYDDAPYTGGTNCILFLKGYSKSVVIFLMLLSINVVLLLLD